MSRATGCQKIPGVVWNTTASKCYFRCRACSTPFADKVDWQRHKLKCYLNGVLISSRIRQGQPALTDSMELKMKTSGGFDNTLSSRLTSSAADDVSRKKNRRPSQWSPNERKEVKKQQPSIVNNRSTNASKFCPSSSPFLKQYRIPKKSDKMGSTGQNQNVSVEDKIKQQIEQAVLSITDDSDERNSIQDVVNELNDLNSEKVSVDSDPLNDSVEEEGILNEQDGNFEPVCENDQISIEEEGEEPVQYILLQTDESEFVDIFGGDDEMVTVQVFELPEGFNCDEDGNVFEYVTTDEEQQCGDYLEEQQEVISDMDMELGAVETIGCEDVTCDDDVRLENNLEMIQEVKVDNVPKPQLTTKPSIEQQEESTMKKKVIKEPLVPSSPPFTKYVLDKKLVISLVRCDDPALKKRHLAENNGQNKGQGKNARYSRKKRTNQRKASGRKQKKSAKRVVKKPPPPETEWDVICPEDLDKSVQQTPIKLKIKRRRLNNGNSAESDDEEIENVLKDENLDAKLSLLYKTPPKKVTENAQPDRKPKIGKNPYVHLVGLKSHEDPSKKSTTDTKLEETDVIKPYKLSADQDSGCGSSVSSEGENYQEKCDSLRSDLCQTLKESPKPHPSAGVAKTTYKTGTSDITIISYSPSKIMISPPGTSCRTKASELAKRKKRKFFDGYCKVCGVECEFQTSKTYYINADPRRPYTCFTCQEDFSGSQWEAHDKSCFVDEEVQMDRNGDRTTLPMYVVMKRRDFSCVDCFKLMSQIRF